MLHGANVTKPKHTQDNSNVMILIFKMVSRGSASELARAALSNAPCTVNHVTYHVPCYYVNHVLQRLDRKNQRKQRKQERARLAEAERLAAAASVDYENYQNEAQFNNLDAAANKEVADKFGETR